MVLARQEGTTKIIVPSQPTKALFYNPRMELCRDIDIASVSAYVFSLHGRAPTYVDALAGTGVRGIRVANEVGVCVTINDRSKQAYELIKRNIALNRVGEHARACNTNANVLLVQRKYDLVDLDPFGSPVPFLDAACQSVKRLLLVTATDTAPLCGAHTGGVRKYSARPLNTEYHAEMATRILLGRVTRDLCRYDKVIQPLLSYSTAHFVRIIARIERGAKRADACMHRLGFIAHCFSCGNRFVVSGTDMLALQVKGKCELCGAKMRIAGPLYTQAIKEQEFCEQVYEELQGRELGKKREALKIVGTCSNELDIPYYYEHHALCKELKIPPPPIRLFMDALLSGGFSVSRTHFSDIAVKTNARVDELKAVLIGL